MGSYFLVFKMSMVAFFLFICESQATINSDFSKPLNAHTPRQQGKNLKNKKNQKKKNKKLKKIYINFTEPKKTSLTSSESFGYESESQAQESYLNDNDNNDLKPNIKIKYQRKQELASNFSNQNNQNKKINLMEKQELGFTNQLVIGYSNSAFRYEGEEFPAKSVDFIWVPMLNSTCFSLECVYSARMIGGLDLNQEGKNEFALLQFGVRFPQSPWWGYLAPSYDLRGFLPATPGEINDDKMSYGYGAGFSLSSTPALFDTDVITVTAALSLRKDVHDAPLTIQRNWMGREALLFDFKLSKSVSATALFGHIYNEYYNQTSRDILELIQIVRWKTNDWLDLMLSHSNLKPAYVGEGTQIDGRFVTPDNSIISIGLGITNKF